MSENDKIELFILKCASLKLAVDHEGAGKPAPRKPRSALIEEDVSPFIDQFPSEIRQNALAMSDHYKLFHMLENDIRRLIDDTLQEKYGMNWWDNHAPVAVEKNAELISNEKKKRLLRRDRTINLIMSRSAIWEISYELTGIYLAEF